MHEKISAIDPRGMTRRKFLYLSSMATAGLISGCAVNPVTGKNQLMLVSEEDEIQIDRQYAPIQLSSDYGNVQDASLSDYVQRTGLGMASQTHRPGMPFSFHAVNAAYINAYAFPGGTIAITRGILLKLESEAELAALIGHELGHVNARHTAQQLSKSTLTQAVIGGISVVAGQALGQGYGQIASQLGMVSAGALLASYSRDNEREADELGLSYSVQSGYGPDGFVELMEMLQSLSKSRPSSIELMFATHPMSEERYQTALESVQDNYQDDRNKPIYRERYMDNTFRLRRIGPAIEAIQEGEKGLLNKDYAEAEARFRKALKIAPDDYAALVMLAKCEFVQEKYAEAQALTSQAKAVYPTEAQAWHISGMSNLKTRRYEAAYADFQRYDDLLPGSAQTVFFQGYAKEGMGDRKEAAGHYYQYLEAVREGPYAQHAYRRLQEWGYVR